MPRRDLRKVRSQAQERRIARKLGGQVTPGSGSGCKPQDVRTADDVASGMDLLVEAKCRVSPTAKQITVKLVDLQQLAVNAAKQGRIGVLAFELGGRDYFIVEQADFRA